MALDSTVEVTRGDVVRIDGGKHACWFLYGGPTVVVKYLVELDASQMWAFNPATLQPMDCESTHPRHTSLILSAQLLKRFRSPTSLDGLKALCAHPAYFVRWEAVRTIAYIDRAAGIEALQAARSDPHPELRAAAENALVASVSC